MRSPDISKGLGRNGGRVPAFRMPMRADVNAGFEKGWPDPGSRDQFACGGRAATETMAARKFGG